jgi:hypothetical protein
MLRDSFSIDLILLILRHPSRNATSIAKALSVKPQIAYSKPRTRQTYFHAVLQRGNSSAKFRLALPRIIRFLSKNQTFWRNLTNEKGSAELVFNHSIFPQAVNGDKCFELFLAPVFCECLSASGIGLKIQASQGYFHPTPMPKTPKT